MNSYSKLSVSILFAVALSTGFISIAYIQRAHAFSIDFSWLPGFGDNQGLNFFGRKGEKGDTGLKDLLARKETKVTRAIKEILALKDHLDLIVLNVSDYLFPSKTSGTGITGPQRSTGKPYPHQS
jgi:hypothetical protein